MQEPDKGKSLVVFEDRKIRRTWHTDEWWYVVEDIVAALTDSRDPKQYMNKMKQRDAPLAEGWVQIVHTLSVPTSGGPQAMNCVNTEGAFRIIQSVPSNKAEPFKQWLAEVGYDRIKEIENPELAQDRVKQYYELKGYPKDWIDKRLRGIAIRQELTDEWKNRGISQQNNFAILTNEISKATFGKTIQEHRELKSLDKKNQNLRDHMTDLELIFSMLGERVTTEITRTKDAKGMDECSVAAVEGGTVAGNARKEAEAKIGKPIVSEENYLGLTGKKRIGKK